MSPSPRIVAALATICLPLVDAVAQRSDSVITFNEIHYHPAEPTEPEWVELHNQMAIRVDLSGWSLTAGVDYVFPETTIVEPGEFVVVSSDPAHAAHGGQANVLGPFAGRLDNGGETLRLRGRHRRIMDEFEYSDGGRWPAAPDGGGVTLAKRDPNTASGRPESWTWSEQPGGTPGASNFAPSAGEIQIDAVGSASPWRYNTNSLAGVEWQLAGFDDSAWLPGEGAFATALVANPSFEVETFSVSPGYVSGNSPITAWSTLENGLAGAESRIGINTPGALDPFANNGAVPDGESVAFIRGGVRALSQTINSLERGERYLLSYRENGRSPTDPIGSATLGGVEVVPVHTVAAVDSLDAFNQPFHHQVSSVFTASAPSHDLQLRNLSGIGDTLLYDAVRLDPVVLYHNGSGAGTLDLPFSSNGDSQILYAELEAGVGGDVSLGFKVAGGAQSLNTHGALWMSIKDGGEISLRAEENGGNHIVGLNTSVPVPASGYRVALIWGRAAGKASLVINNLTIFNDLDLNATAGGSDGRFTPAVAGVTASFTTNGGDLSELAVATGRSPDTNLPPLEGENTFQFRSEFDLETVPDDAALLLSLANSGAASVFVNGSELHQADASGSQTLILPGDALVSGTNVLAIELTGGADATLQAALTIIASGSGGTRPPIQLSEIDAAGSESFFVEIHNPGAAPIDLIDFTLNDLALPAQSLGPGGHLALTVDDLGFLPADEDALFLKTSTGVVVDAERVENRLRALDVQSDSWQHPDLATPGTANSFSFDTRVVINEIHYHQRPTYPDPVNSVAHAENPLEWIELYNRSSEPVELTGWTLRDAIRYEFPPGSILPAGGFLVVSGSEYSGALNNRRDRIHLQDAHDNTVDEVEYLDGAPWPPTADGRGSSLELIHPDADNAHPQSWAASDESDKSAWSVFTYRGQGAEPPGNNNPDYFHEFLMGMLAAGEALIDDISVLEDPDGAAIQLVQNGDFESDVAGDPADKWRILGNHRHSRVVDLPGGGKALKLVATGRLEHSYNLASTTFANGRTISSGKTYEISFRARWLSGSPQLNTRLYFNRFARTHILQQPALTGTPGAPNSTRRAAAPPTISGFRHAPLVPDENTPVRIHATLAAPDGVSGAVAHYNTGGGWQSAPMSGNADGEYVAILPSLPGGTVAQFYVEATANSGQTAFYPPAGADSRALLRIGDRGAQEHDGQTLRIIMLADEADFMHTAHHTPSNHRVGATLISNDRDIWYDAGVRLRGSPFGRRGSRAGWNIKFPADRPFRGVHETIAIDGGFSIPRGDGTGFISVGAGVATNELIYNQMAHRAGGVPSSFDDVVYIEAPRPSDDKLAQLKMARFGDIWKSSSFDRGDEGTSFKFELVYHPRNTVDGNPESLKSVYNRVLGIDIRDMGSDKEAYRFNFWVQNHSDRDDYAPVISAGRAISEPAPDLRDATDLALDIDNWLRVMAFQSLTMTLDSYNNGLPHNMLLYGNPDSGKTMWIPWDVDHAFYAAPSSSIFGQANGDFADVIQIPANRRAYCGHLLDICNTGFNPAYVADWVSHFNEVGEQAIAAHFTQWITDRRNYVLGRLDATHPAQTFRITSGGGNDFNTDDYNVSLRGKGWIDVHSIRLGTDGDELEVFWFDNNDWDVSVPLLAGANFIELAAFDYSGNPVGSDTITVTLTSDFEAATAANLVVSEIMYHPADPTPAEIAAGFTDAELFEFIELQNIGANTVEMGATHFVEGVTFDFVGNGIAPGGRLVVVRSRAAFGSRYGAGLPIAGEFEADTGLSNGGERLRIADESGTTIRDFSYDDEHPWAESADGAGFSLVLINPTTNPDHALASSWRSSSTPGGNPGTTDATSFTGDPHADDDGDGLSNWMNYALGGSGLGIQLNLSATPSEALFTHRRNLSADDVVFSIDSSSDLVTWTRLTSDSIDEISLGDGTSAVTWELPTAGARAFARLRAESR